MHFARFGLLLFLPLISCSSDPKESSTDTYHLALKETPDVDQQLSLSAFADNIRYVPLETTPEILTGMIMKSVVKKGILYLLTNSRILIFDLNGKYLNKIEAPGKGPLEYVSIHDFTVSEDGKIVYVLDRKKILKFNRAGKAVGTITISDNAENLEMHDGNLYYFIPAYYYTDSLNYKIKILDSLGNVKGGFKSRVVNRPLAYSMPAYFYSDKSNLYFVELCSDTAFAIHEKTLTPHLVFQLGDKLAPVNLFESMERYRKEYGQYIFPGTAAETDQYLFLKYILKDVRRVVVYNKEEQKRMASGALGKAIINDIDGIPFWPSCSENNVLINIYEPIEIKAAIPDTPDKSSDAFEKITQVKDTDNPVLQIVELK